jgi:hypothetical protein
LRSLRDDVIARNSALHIAPFSHFLFCKTALRSDRVQQAKQARFYCIAA